MTDLNDLLISDAPVAHQLEHPMTFEPLTNKKGEPMEVLLLGPDAEAAKIVERKISADMLQRASRSRKGRLELTPEITEAHARRRFLARLAGWNNLELGGKKFEYNDANKNAVYDEAKFGMIKRQIDAALADDAAFLQSANSLLD